MRVVEPAKSSLVSSLYFEMASLILTRESGCGEGVVAAVGDGAGTGAGTGTGTGTGSPAQEAFDAHWLATDLASSHFQTSVDLRLNSPLRVPEAKTGQSQDFQPFLRSSNSPEQ